MSNFYIKERFYFMKDVVLEDVFKERIVKSNIFSIEEQKKINKDYLL